MPSAYDPSRGIGAFCLARGPDDPPLEHWGLCPGNRLDPGVLDVLDLGRGCLGNMHCTAANQNAARGKRRYLH